jgi:Zn ribbon nucleic-acid-binding protein
MSFPHEDNFYTPAHPDCPLCQSADAVVQQVWVEIVEFRTINAEGSVIDSTDRDYREDVRSNWYCIDCDDSWGDMDYTA